MYSIYNIIYTVFIALYVVSVLFRMYIPAVRPPMLTQYVLCRLHSTLLRSACTKEWTTSIACTRIHTYCKQQRLGENLAQAYRTVFSNRILRNTLVLLTVYKEVVTPVHCKIVATHDSTIHMLRYLQHYVQLASFPGPHPASYCLLNRTATNGMQDEGLQTRLF